MRWHELSQSEQKAHSLNGFGGWLIPMFAIMLGLSVVFLWLTTQTAAANWAIAEYGEVLGKAFIDSFHLWSIAATIIWGLLLWMARQGRRSFPTATLLLMWPLLVWSNALNLPLLGIRQTLINFGFWAIVPVAISAYLLISNRVNVTYHQRQRPTAR